MSVRRASQRANLEEIIRSIGLDLSTDFDDAADAADFEDAGAWRPFP
jgi:hypothetical protein